MLDIPQPTDATDLLARVTALESKTPLLATADVVMPALSLLATATYAVSVPGAAVGNRVFVEPPDALLTGGSLSCCYARVTAANTVTITLKAAAALGGGTRAFLLTVIR